MLVVGSVAAVVRWVWEDVIGNPLLWSIVGLLLALGFGIFNTATRRNGGGNDASEN